jgi:hypothetical protein
MTETSHRNASTQIQIAFARHVKNIAARAMTQDHFKASVTRHDVFCE